MRWIWIDRLLDLQHGVSARTVKYLSLAEDHFADHFPGYPVMPATLILEGLAQTGGILVGDANDFKEKVVLAKVPKVVFHREMLAGEQLIFEAEILHMRPEGAAVSARVLVNGVVTAEAEIFFAHLDQNRAAQIFGEHNFVFDGPMRRILQGRKGAEAKPASPASN